MSERARAIGAYSIMALALVAVGFGQSWSVSLAILNICLISAVMALGVNIQWGYAGLFNVGVMAFAALGGLAAVLISKPLVPAAISAGGAGLLLALFSACLTGAAVWWATRLIAPGRWRVIAVSLLILAGFIVTGLFFDPAVEVIEAVDPSAAGYIGGLGLPVILSWGVAGLFAAGVAWVIARIALGLRADYLAIATLGIAEIVISVLKNEDWLARGVKNVTGLARPVPYEVNLQQTPWFIDLVVSLNSNTLSALAEPQRAAALRDLVITASSVFVKLCYAGLFASVLLLVFILSERALRSPWGRMMRAIRDNEEAAEALGKDVVRRHRQVFVLGSAIVGIAGAMLTTLEGQFTPGSYNPLRFTFLIWVMVIVGGSGNNLGAILGGFLIWFVWIEAEPAGLWLVQQITSTMESDSPLRSQLVGAAAHMRPIVMGLILLCVMRFSPRGLIPETIRR